MMKALVILLFGSILFTSCQNTENIQPNIELRNDFCYHDGKQFSSGSIIKMNGVQKRCLIGRWINVKTNLKTLNKNSFRAASYRAVNNTDTLNLKKGCFYKEKTYSHGASIVMNGIKKTCYNYFGNGMWQTNKERKNMTTFLGN